ncbi:MAG: hypothetical protein AAB134_07985 [Pseudomonadota bacterium]
MNMKIAPALVRATMFCPAILFGLLVAPIGFLAAFVGGVPNQITTSFMEQWPLLKILWASNPGAAIQILIQQPLMVIAHSEPANGMLTWRLFFYPVPLAVYLAVSIFTAIILRSGARGATLRRLVLLLPGMALLAFVATYVQIAACCTGGPRWALDIWLFSLAYNPLSTLIDWQQFYIRVEGIFSIVQAVLALLGVALLVTGARRAKGVKARR